MCDKVCKTDMRKDTCGCRLCSDIDDGGCRTVEAVSLCIQAERVLSVVSCQQAMLAVCRADRGLLGNWAREPRNFAKENKALMQNEIRLACINVMQSRFSVCCTLI
jgi:hypothetical protein